MIERDCLIIKEAPVVAEGLKIDLNNFKVTEGLQYYSKRIETISDGRNPIKLKNIVINNSLSVSCAHFITSFNSSTCIQS